MQNQLRVRYLQHVSFETPANIMTYFKERHIIMEKTALYKGEPLPELETFDVLIIMGGPMGIEDADIYPWLIEEKVLIREAITTGKKVIGICLGAQLIAHVLGARVYAGNDKEIGWFDIKPYKGNVKHLLSGCFDGIYKVFHWHGDTFDLPEEAVGLASSEACKNQGFMYKEQVLGLQFHIEMTQEAVAGIVKNAHSELDGSKYVQSQEVIESSNDYYGANKKLLYEIFDEFL